MSKTTTTTTTTTKHFTIGLLIRIILLFILPILMDDGLLLSGVRYTDIDYDVFTDAADHVANSRSPYRRHTYRYTPFLAMLLSLPISRHNSAAAASNSGILGVILSTKYFGKILFCIADAICGYIILILRQRSRRDAPQVQQPQMNKRQMISIAGKTYYMPKIINKLLSSSPEFIDAMWWLYNPLPINICTRGSAEALIVLLPVLVTVALANHQNNQSTSIMMISSTRQRAILAGILHGIGIHCKLYPIIYTVSFMANFSRQEQQQQHQLAKQPEEQRMEGTVGWTNVLSYEQSSSGFPWKHPMKIITLALLWIQRLFFTWSSILFLLSSILTMVTTTYSAVHFYGNEALNEGLLYHFGRMDHRHNYSMYWYWIYLLRGRQEVVSVGASTSTWVGNVPLIPQILILGFSSLGIAPYDLTFALFCQTFCFVAFNKVMTAQYFTWYLCLLPLCSDRIQWSSRRMILSLGLLLISILTWLGCAFTLEMLGWRSHRQVWMASVLFFIANLNLMVAIVDGYRVKKLLRRSEAGRGLTRKSKAKQS